MEIVDIARNLSGLKKKQKERFFENTRILFSQLNDSIVLRGPYRLVLDSNIIMRLESYKKGNITEGVLSVFLFFEFLKRTNLQVDIVIRPTVFYEYSRQKKFESIREHWNSFKELRDLIQEELSVVAFFDGIETFEGTEYYLDLIEHDVALISHELRSYETRSWKFDFIRPHGGFVGTLLNNDLIEVSPFFAADGMYESLGFKYFDEVKTSRFLIEHMCKRICECKDNDQRIINKYSDSQELILTKVLKLTAKGNLVGIADIDLLNNCNIQSQFKMQSRGRYFPASIGLSMDTNLSKSLSYFSGIHLNSGDILGGENAEDGKAKLEAFFHDKTRVGEGDQRVLKLISEQREFFDEVFPILSESLEMA